MAEWFPSYIVLVYMGTFRQVIIVQTTRFNIIYNLETFFI
jgi:hypothetical protein